MVGGGAQPHHGHPRPQAQARKGNLKRQSNHYLSIKDVPLDKQRLADLKRRLETVVENAAAYDVIQDRIEEVEQEVDTPEEGEIRDQRISNNELTDAYQTLIEASQAWTSGERLQDEAQDLQQSEDISGVYARQTYEQLVSDYKQFCQGIKKLADYTELKQLKEELDPVIQELSTRIDKELVVASPEGSVSSHHSDPTPKPPRPFQSKLNCSFPTSAASSCNGRIFGTYSTRSLKVNDYPIGRRSAIYRHP